jgi:hypothetical protein
MKQTTNNTIFTLNQNEKKKRVEIGNHLPSSNSSSLITSGYSMLHQKA